MFVPFESVRIHRSKRCDIQVRNLFKLLLKSKCLPSSDISYCSVNLIMRENKTVTSANSCETIPPGNLAPKPSAGNILSLQYKTNAFNHSLFFRYCTFIINCVF